MSVTLEDFPTKDFVLVPLKFGGLMPSALGGETDRIDRLGNRWAAEVMTPVMRVEPAGRRWHAILTKSERLGVIVEIPLLDFDPGFPGTPLVSANTAAGRLIPLKGLTPGYEIRIGHPLNYYDATGRAYLDMAAERVLADESGNATVEILNLLRVPLLVNAPIELARPVIEGWIEGDIPLPKPLERVASFSFRIVEKA